MSIVSNTGPLIALAKVDALSLLKVLFTEVSVTPSVYLELFAKAGPEVYRLQNAFQDFIKTDSMPSVLPDLTSATRHLGAGEQQAVLLAHHTSSLLLIDDHQGRSVARSLGVTVIGTAGVVLQAKQIGLIPVVIPLLEQIRQNGYWLSNALLTAVALQAGELFSP